MPVKKNIVRNVQGKVVHGITPQDNTFGVQWTDYEGDVRGEGVAYDVRQAYSLASATRCFESLIQVEPDHPAVKSAAIIAYDDRGELHVIREFPASPATSDVKNQIPS